MFEMNENNDNSFSYKNQQQRRKIRSIKKLTNAIT